MKALVAWDLWDQKEELDKQKGGLQQGKSETETGLTISSFCRISTRKSNSSTNSMLCFSLFCFLKGVGPNRFT